MTCLLEKPLQAFCAWMKCTTKSIYFSLRLMSSGRILLLLSGGSTGISCPWLHLPTYTAPTLQSWTTPCRRRSDASSTAFDIELSAGSTGVSLAMVAAAYGCRCHIAMPDDAALEKSQLLSTLGAQVQRVRPVSITHPGHFVNVARRVGSTLLGHLLFQKRPEAGAVHNIVYDPQHTLGVSGQTACSWQHSHHTEHLRGCTSCLAVLW